MFCRKRASKPQVRLRPELAVLMVFPHEYPAIEHDAQRLDPGYVISQAQRLEDKRASLERRFIRTRSESKAEALEEELRDVEFRLHWLLLVRREQRGDLPRVSFPSPLLPPD